MPGTLPARDRVFFSGGFDGKPLLPLGRAEGLVGQLDIAPTPEAPAAQCREATGLKNSLRRLRRFVDSASLPLRMRF
jgi:hypothetical protein